MFYKKNPFIITKEGLEESLKRYNENGSKSSISKMNEWQKYKNRYSRILMDAKDLLRRLGK